MLRECVCVCADVETVNALDSRETDRERVCDTYTERERKRGQHKVVAVVERVYSCV